MFWSNPLLFPLSTSSSPLNLAFLPTSHALFWTLPSPVSGACLGGRPSDGAWAGHNHEENQLFPCPAAVSCQWFLGSCLVCSSAVHAGLADLTLCRVCTCSPCHYELLGATSCPVVSRKHYFTIGVQSLWCFESFYLYENHTTETILNISFHPSAVSLAMIELNPCGWVPAEKLVCNCFSRSQAHNWT